MFTIYIAKATANYGLPATRPIYERALEGVLTLTMIMQHKLICHFVIDQSFRIVKLQKCVCALLR
jgi:hypothetical protein